jgi:IclR family transcriptional regulator, KDG regulon repressor
MGRAVAERSSATTKPASSDDWVGARPAATQPNADGELDTSVGKALALLEAFRDANRALGVTDLARIAGLPKSTAYRLLSILRERGLVERSGSGYCLGARLFELGNSVPYCHPRGLREVASPHLMHLYEASHETVHLAVLDGTEVLFIDRLCGDSPPAAASRVGSRLAAEAAALGKVMLAFSDGKTVAQVLARGLQRLSPYTIVQPQHFIEHLRVVRSAGLAFDREEAFVGLACVAAPVLGADGRALAAVSLAGPSHRFRPEDFGERLRRATSDISRELLAPR